MEGKSIAYIKKVLRFNFFLAGIIYTLNDVRKWRKEKLEELKS